MTPSRIEPAHVHPALPTAGHRAVPARHRERPVGSTAPTTALATRPVRPVATLPGEAPGTTIEYPVIEPVDKSTVVPDRPWLVIVWNDPVNLMSFVTFVFQKLFGYSKEKATLLMLDVHHRGRAVVSSGTRERAEVDVYRLHQHGLWATLEQAG